MTFSEQRKRAFNNQFRQKAGVNGFNIAERSKNNATPGKSYGSIVINSRQHKPIFRDELTLEDAQTPIFKTNYIQPKIKNNPNGQQFSLIKGYNTTYNNDINIDARKSEALNKRHNTEALAQELQNLIIFERGTFPNDPDLGVGIANYIMELSDTDTMIALRNNIQTQIDHYLPHAYLLLDFDINITEEDADNHLSQGIEIIFNIQYNDADPLDKESKNYMIDLVVSMNQFNQRLISSLSYS